MKVKELPLQGLFYELRSSGLVLGIDDYELLLQALMRGFGISEQQPLTTLKRLCKALWVKSLADGEKFDRCFEQYSYSQFQQDPESEPSPEPSLNLPTPEPIAELPPEPIAELPPEPISELPSEPISEISTPENGQSLSVDSRMQVKKDTFKLPEMESFLLFSEYLPISKRQMQQSWRYLRRFVREGQGTEIDFPQTIDQFAQQRIFLEPVLAPRRVNRVELVVLLDIDGSMTAFHSLAERIRETAIEAGGRSRVYYFHNCPVKYLYHNREQTEYVTFRQVLQELSSTDSSLLVFSDGGAARGGYRDDRLELTQEFLTQFQRKIRRIVWLNPIPQERWAGTTAGEIAQLVPMVPGSDPSSFQQAIKILQGSTNPLYFSSSIPAALS